MEDLLSSKRTANLSGRGWQAPSAVKLSVRETRNLNGDDSDFQGAGGIWIADGLGKPTKLSMPTDDTTKLVLGFLESISSSPEKLEAAIFRPDKAIADAGLTEKHQIKIVKRILTHLGS